ncbi:hypothetical protein [Bifidobacterium longum]|uniref:Uncharacterized protein n=1 Tax=Bifidobacterium longum subsp. longum TaxID=1679 RepID=A0A4R0TVY9_BIFLL|nr:hypothetical protein [Bifidobacterium longum]TCE86259.1 hypothetical protein MCC10070_0945 [Bifidobacterium longum subsp. longum]
MSEKIDLQQKALNALKDAGLGSNSLRQAFIKGYRAHAYRQPSQEEEHVAAVTMSGRMRSIFHLEESDEDNLTSKCSCIYSDIQTALLDILPRMNAGDSRISRFGFLFATTRQEGRGR